MTKILKLRHIVLIVSVIIMAIGMAVGTVCHFVSNGFFNYGDEFSSYKSIEVTTSAVEDVNGNTLLEVANEELASLGAYEVSFSKSTGYLPNTVVYKLGTSVSDEAIDEAVAAVKAHFEGEGYEDFTVSSYFNEAKVNGIYVLNFTAIALSSAVVFQAIYFAIRFKPGMALAGLMSQVAAVGVYASLLAITRCPVGLEAIAFAAVAVVLNMILCGLFFDNVKKSYKDENNEKAETLQLIAAGGQSTAKVNLFVCIAAAAAAVILAVFALIAAPSFVTLAPFAAFLIAVISCAFAFALFTPSAYAVVSVIDRRNIK